MGSTHFLSLLRKDTNYPQLTEPPFRPGELEMVGLKAASAGQGVFG